MIIVIISAAVILLMIILTAVSTHRNSVRTDKHMRSSYGSIREYDSFLEDRMNEVAALFKHDSKDIPADCLVDDITWNDLDMDTIFALANHTDSFAGEQCLYSDLRILSRDKDTMNSREKLTQFYDGNEEKRNAVRRILLRLGKPIASYDISSLSDTIEDMRMPGSRLFPVRTAALLLTLAGGLLLKSTVLSSICLVIYLFNLVQHLRIISQFETRMNTVSAMGNVIGAATEISGIIPEHSEGISAELGEFRKTASWAAGMMRLSGMMSNDDMSNLFFSYILGPLLLDFIAYDRFISVIAGKKEQFMKVFRFVGENDCAIAIASYRRSLEHYCIPVTGPLGFSGLTHPAISGAVPNDLEVHRNIILTGSNASGKSTFIKAVAINIILARTICTCTADAASVPECGVATSMAVRDDILSGESYYIREIRYIKRMADLCADDRLIFLAIDEILRGTNTRERIAASKAVLRYFAGRKCILMAATHDIELAYALDGEFDNFYFTETLNEGDVVFDYTIRPGISTTSNAIRLLGAVGFPEEIITEALKELEEQA